MRNTHRVENAFCGGRVRDDAENADCEVNEGIVCAKTFPELDEADVSALYMR